ncbi:MAG: TetR/AcrR family transcriptional regulator [Nocardiopsaceae bacterium]|nr:TetR/AcrR family transcriptional regulator [Nocardiopsaceae bacterium]
MASGLRESKKLALREALSVTTVLLAREQGLGNVRVEDIVERVGVSRRTFSNYFSSKEDAIADRLVQRARIAADALLTRPADEPLWTAVTEAVLMPYEDEPDAAAQTRSERTGLLAVLSDPEMQSAVDRGVRAATAALGSAIAERLDVSVSDDPRPYFVANAALSTLLLTLERWVGLREPEPMLLPLLREAFQRLGDGLDRLP